MNDEYAWIGCLAFVIGGIAVIGMIALVARVAVLGHP
jgi:hypothetical protein